MDDDQLVHITQSELDELVKDREFLLCLFAVGVENWEGYEDALSMAAEDEDE